MSISFNDAQRNDERASSPIPKGEIVSVIISANEKKGLTNTTASGATGLNLVFTVTSGKYSRRLIWSWMGIKGDGSAGHKTMVDITFSSIRAILESARGVEPSDDSEAAMKARSINDWEDLIGLEFVGRVGIEESTYNGETRERNTIFAVTPNEDDYASSGFKPAKPKMATAQREPATTNSEW